MFLKLKLLLILCFEYIECFTLTKLAASQEYGKFKIGRYRDRYAYVSTYI